MNRPVSTLTDDEVFRIQKFFDRSVLTNHQGLLLCRNRLLIYFMLEAGLRVGEVLRLLKGNLFICDSIVTNLDIGYAIAEKGSSRVVPVSVALHDAIQLMNLNVWQPFGITSDDSAFALEHGDPVITTRQVEHIVDSVSVAAIGRHVHPHCFRHTFASRVLRRSNLRVTQTLLGHQSIVSTQVYTHPDMNDLQKAVNPVN